MHDMNSVIFFLSTTVNIGKSMFLLSFIVKNVISDRICSTIEKLCETIEKTYKLKTEKIAILKANQRQLQKAYCKGALPHLSTIEVIRII